MDATELDEAATEVAPPRAPTPRTPQPAVVPDLISGEERSSGRYHATDLLGEGGMGEVRLCRDRRVGRDVAMKVIRPDQAQRPEVRARFLREARVQGQLEHPAIVPVYDIAFGDDGATHFTMKRVRGRTLAEVVSALARGDERAAERFSRRKLLSAFDSVCLAVEFAHERGVVHRDLKPENVMLGDFGEVYVLDWGVARVAGADPSREEVVDAPVDASGRTRDGAVIGTPGYMAPEQMRGEAVDARSDVYSLGAMLFELLALTPLHPRGSAEAIVATTLTGVESRPSRRAPALTIAPELDAICERATRVDPAERYPSARALHAEVERFLDGDRDLALRRAMADRHADEAERLAERALSGGPGALDARAEAMRTVGRAIALAPDHPTALRVMMRLLVEPPDEVPAEAEEDLDANSAAQTRAGAHAGGFAYLSWFAFMPLLAWMGVREWESLAASAALILSAGLLCFVIAASERPSRLLQTAALVAGTLASASTYRIFGPWVLLSSMVTANALLFSLSPAAARFKTGAALGCLAIAVPALLEFFGVIPPSTSFEGGVMRVAPRMTSFPPTAAFVFLLVTHLGVVLTTTTLMTRIRASLQTAERRLRVHAWHLRMLVPEEVRRAGGPSSPPEPACEVDRCLIGVSLDGLSPRPASSSSRR